MRRAAPAVVLTVLMAFSAISGGLAWASTAVSAPSKYVYDVGVPTAATIGAPMAEVPDEQANLGLGRYRDGSRDRYDDRSRLARASARLAGYRLAPNTAPPLFSQTTASRTFRHGSFADQSIGDVAGGLRAGKISPAELPVDVIVRNGETIGLNTRSMLALRLGGIDPADWMLKDVTGMPGMERLLTERLLRNQLTGGTDVLRITGAGPNASSLL